MKINAKKRLLSTEDKLTKKQAALVEPLRKALIGQYPDIDIIVDDKYLMYFIESSESLVDAVPRLRKLGIIPHWVEYNMGAFSPDKTVLVKSDTCYHITSKKFVGSILKSGLKVPDGPYYRNSRVYMFTEYDPELFKTFIKNESIREPLLLEINTNGIPLYLDPENREQHFYKNRASFTLVDIKSSRVNLLDVSL